MSTVPSDIEIAHSVIPQHIREIATKLHIAEGALEYYGKHKVEDIHLVFQEALGVPIR